jgi:hypothetical protein
MTRMIFFLPLDLNLIVPLSGMLDKLLLDFDMLDIVLWFPRLSWGELLRALGAVLLCKCASDQIERWAFAPLKSRLKRRVAAGIAARWPQLARRVGIGA